MFKGINRLWFLPILMFLMALPCFGQTTDGAMTGKVTDQTGAVISSASVKVVNKDTSLSFNVATDGQGLFHLEHLPVGRYTVSAEASGFKKTTADVLVGLNQVVDVSIKLQAGGVEEVITVEAGEVLVETSTSTLTSTFDARKVVDLPSVNGSQLELALLAPNVTSQAGGTVGEGGSVGGNRPRNNSFNVDGVDNNDPIVTGHVIDVIPEAVAEFTILTNQYSAEFGHSSAGQFNTITKSGTNEYHGGLFYLNNNKDYNALSHLIKESIAQGAAPDRKPRFDFNRLGGTIGGPLIKNKLFFFGAFQYKTEGTAGDIASSLNPTAEGIATLSTLKGVSPFTLNLLKQFLPTAAAAEDTVTVLGKSIPVGTVNILIPSFFNRYTFNVNIDQIYGNNDQFRYRYNYDRFRAPNIGNGNVIFNGSQEILDQLASFTYIHTFKPTLINEFRFSYSRQNQAFAIPSQFAGFPNIEIDDTNIAIGPEGNSPQGAIVNKYQYVDNISLVKGKHNFKAGVEVRNLIAPNQFLPRGRGEYDYESLEQFLKDDKPTGLNGALRGVGIGAFAANQKVFYTFVQDDFHVTSNFTLNLGVRYEYTGLFRDERLQALNDLASVPSLIVFKKPDTDKNDVAPRLGLAWSPAFKSGPLHYLFPESGKASLRAGFGISYDVLFGNLATLQLPIQFQNELDGAGGDGGIFGTDKNFLQNGGLGNFNPVPQSPQEARALTSSFISDHTNPYSISYTLDYQRELGRKWAVDIRYLGTRGVKLITQTRLNAPRNPFKIAGFSLPVYLNASQVPDKKTLDSMHTLNELVAIRNNNFGLGDPEFQTPTVTTFLPIGSSNYHSGSVQVTRRFSDGFTVSGVYTYSHTIDFGTNDLFTSRINPRRAQDTLDIGDQRGNSALDRRQRFVAYGLWDLPFFNHSKSHLLRTLAGGWRLSAIYTAEDGQPFTALSGTDSNLNFDSAGDRAILNPNGVRNTGSGVTAIRNSKNQVVAYLAKNGNAEFIQAGPGSIATVGSNTLRSPGINNWDATIFKNFAITETMKLEFRMEMFNVFNHEQLVVGGGSVFAALSNALSVSYANVSSPNFNNERQFAGRPRIINFGLKLIF